MKTRIRNGNIRIKGYRNMGYLFICLTRIAEYTFLYLIVFLIACILGSPFPIFNVLYPGFLICWLPFAHYYRKAAQMIPIFGVFFKLSDAIEVLLKMDYTGQCKTLGKTGLGDIKAVTAGNRHTAALRQDGTVIAWGGEDSHIKDFSNGLSEIREIAAAPSSIFALKEDGTVIFPRSPKESQPNAISELTDVIHVAACGAKGAYIATIKSNGDLIVWSDDKNPSILKDINNVKAVAVGFNHVVVLKKDGTIAVWSEKIYNQFRVPDGHKKITVVAAGAYHAVAIQDDGTVVAWGKNNKGQCDVPPGLSGVKAIAAGYGHTLAVKTDGTVISWGLNDFGQCDVPDGLCGVKAVAAGKWHSVALHEDGSITAWGNNKYKQCDTPSIRMDLSCPKNDMHQNRSVTKTSSFEA